MFDVGLSSLSQDVFGLDGIQNLTNVALSPRGTFHSSVLAASGAVLCGLTMVHTNSATSFRNPDRNVLLPIHSINLLTMAKKGQFLLFPLSMPSPANANQQNPAQ